MASTNIGYMMLLIFVLGIVSLFALMALNDIRIYRNLQKRLREDQRRE